MQPSSPPIVNVEEIMREIRERVERRRTDGLGPPALLVGSAMAEPDLSYLNQSLARVRERAAEFGTMPACPPTLRGRVGSFLVLLVRRMLSWYTSQLKGLAGSLSEALENQVDALEIVRRVTAEPARQTGDLEKLKSQVADVQGKLEAQVAALSALSSQIAVAARQLTDETAAREDLSHRIERLPASGDLARLKSQIIAQDRRITVLLQESRPRPPAPFDQQQLKQMADESRGAFEELYVAFEDEFRGTREEIKQRLLVYLPYIRAARCGTAGMPILDLGCGRGEWLELLRDTGLEARGLDTNRCMVERCRELGLTVEHADAFEVLRGLPDGSLGAVTGFHIVEHLPWERLLELVDETVRVLRPGGLAIFETPNPENVLVGSYSFYLDPTHRAPLPAPLLRFVVEARGLCDVQVLMLQIDPEAARVSPDGSYWSPKLSQYFYGPRDYGILATKA